MTSISVDSISVDQGTIQYNLSYEGSVKKFFKNDNAELEYDVDLTDVPKSILAIPVVTAIAPVSWVTGADMYVSELDKKYYLSLPNIRKGLDDLYSDVEFGGDRTVHVEDIHDSKFSSEGPPRPLILFSSGVDSTYAALKHQSENPILLSIKESKVVDEQWKKPKQIISEFSKHRCLEDHYVRSELRELLNRDVLTLYFSHKLNRGWSGAVYYGLGHASHAAPLSGAKTIETVIEGSGFTHNRQFPEVQPRFFHELSWSGTSVQLSGVDKTRQQKINYICANHPSSSPVLLSTGCSWNDTLNCSECQKCLRTILGILIAGENPEKYGYTINEKTLESIKDTIRNMEPNDFEIITWYFMQRELIDGDTDKYIKINNLQDEINNLLNWFENHNLEIDESQIPKRTDTTVGKLVRVSPSPVEETMIKIYSERFRYHNKLPYPINEFAEFCYHTVNRSSK